MAQTFYDNSVTSQLQILEAIGQVLQRGAEHAGQTGMDLGEIVNFRLSEDMQPFSFQVVCVWHYTLGAMKGMQAGLMGPAPSLQGLDYEQLQGLISEAREHLEGLDRDEVEDLSGRDMVFRSPNRELTFTMDDYLNSLVLPNFYFHATMIYAILRLKGVPLGKMDFLGKVRVKT